METNWEKVCERDGITILAVPFSTNGNKRLLEEFYLKMGDSPSLLIVESGSEADAEACETVAIAVHLAPGKQSQIVHVDSREGYGIVKEFHSPHGVRIATVSRFRDVALRCALCPPNGAVVGFLVATPFLSERPKVFERLLAARGSWLPDERLSLEMSIEQTLL